MSSLKLAPRAFLAVFFTLFAAACGNDITVPRQAPPGAPGTAPTVTVVIPAGAIGMGMAAYGQNPLQVPAGTTVTWVNQDTHPHTVTSDQGVWDSGTLNPGQTFSRKFDAMGSFPYHCEIHGAASMSGMIVVTTGASPSPTPSVSPSPTPSPSVTPSPSPSPQMVNVMIEPGATGKGSAAYGQNPLTVAAGTTVKWTNMDSMTHTVTSDTALFDSGTMMTGQTFSHTFTAPGMFPYHCMIHGSTSMSGMVKVQ